MKTLNKKQLKKNFIFNLETAMEYNDIQTQLALASVSGIAQSCISDWLAGKSLPSYKNLVRLADSLDFDVDYFTEQ
jgi:Helix-turn-helix